MNTKLIIALDYENQHAAMTLVDQVDPMVCALKVGNELFTRFGTTFVRELLKRDFNVFLDLKYHDIPNTVAAACKAAADLGIWMLNVHASGGLAMMQAARRAVEGYHGRERPLLMAVTVLTSMNPETLSSIGVVASMQEQVVALAQLAIEAGLDGVVSSALEVPMIKAACGPRCKTVTPGIRLNPAPDVTAVIDDQSRICTPEKALQLGSDYLVVGRPITRAERPHEVISELVRIVSAVPG